MNSFARVILTAVCILLLAPSLFVFAQVATRTGSIYGKVMDDKGAPLPGVNITLESDIIPAQTASSGPSGGFRFANLPPGLYSLNFAIQGFTEVLQEGVQVSTGTEVQLEILLRPFISEEITVIGESPVVDTKKTGVNQNFRREYLEKVPSARDPWAIIDQATGINSDRYNVAGSESGQQAAFYAHGGTAGNTIWNYDGVNVTDPGAIGASPTYFDFDAFEELSISTGGNDVSVPTGGVVVNIVTRRAGNRWEGNGSFYFVSDSLQADNTPDELKEIGAKSNRLDKAKDYGFDVGGSIVKDRLFTWGAFHKSDISLITISEAPDVSTLTDYNFKANMNWNFANESQFGYFNGEKEKSGSGINVFIQAPETLWEQTGTETILPGIWTGQHTWIPNDHTIITGRYGYIGLGFTLVSRGGIDKPMILLGAIPRYEQTYSTFAPIDRPAHDFVVDANYYAENLIGGDHEFKFGFEYKTSKLQSDSYFGNGLYIIDSAQKTTGGPLTYGYLYVLHNNHGQVTMPRTSFYVNDTYRKDRLTLNLGFRFDSQTGQNDAGTAFGAPGAFASLLGPVEFNGFDPGVTFNNISPRVGMTYDLTGDGKTVVRANYARYYNGWNPAYLTFSNPAYTFSGAYGTYVNANGDREVTLDEFTLLDYFGGATQTFDLNAFLAKKTYADDVENSGSSEFIAGFERQIAQDLSLSVNYTYRSYFNPLQIDPAGVSAADYVQSGDVTFNTTLGSFTVPRFLYAGTNNGTLILHNVRDYSQTYNGLDFNVRKRMSNNFMMAASMVLQKQSANYDGGDSALYVLGDGGIAPGTPFPGNPGNVAFADKQPYAYTGGRGKSGVYPYAEWQFKFSGVYQFPYDISLGAFARYQQGYPYVLWGSNSDPGLFPALNTGTSHFLVELFGSRRYGNIFTLDLQVEKALDFDQYGRLNLSANFFNVTNSNTVIARERDVTTDILNHITEVISPMAVRLGVRYSF